VLGLSSDRGNAAKPRRMTSGYGELGGLVMLLQPLTTTNKIHLSPIRAPRSACGVDGIPSPRSITGLLDRVFGSDLPQAT
jgi:hypothetical protein